MTVGGRAESGGGIASAVAFSAIAQVGAKFVHFGLNAVAGLALIRYMGPAGYGDYVFVFTFATLFGLVSDFGLTKVAVREMSRDERQAPAVLGTAILARLVLAALSLVLAQASLAVMGIEPELRAAIGVASLLFVVDAGMSLTAIFQVRLAMQYEALVVLVVQALDTALILTLIALDAGLMMVVAAPILTGAVGLGLAAAIARRRFGSRLRVEPRRLGYLLREAAPLGVTTVLVVLYVKTDAVLLGLLATPHDVGLFGAAYKPIEYLILALMAVVNILFPLLARWRGSDPVRFRTVYWRGMDALLALALPLAVILVLVADPLVVALYAPDFAASAAPLRLLTVAMVFMIVSAWQGFALLSAGHQRVTLAYDAAALVLNIGLNLVLIPLLGYLGAAFAAIGTSLFVTACSSFAAYRLLDVHEGNTRLGRLLLATAGTGLLLTAVLSAGIPWWTAAVIAGVTYPAWLLAFGATSRGELHLLIPRPRRLPPLGADL